VTDRAELSHKRALIVGVGGLGSPVAIALASAGVGVLGLIDDDAVEVSNLHRQILFNAGDVGRHKIDAAVDALAKWIPDSTISGLEVKPYRMRLAPDNARAIVSGYDVVVEGSDNFATKFMTADACALEKVAVVHGSAVRWHGTALAVSATARPCYRCLFEDIPHEAVQNCAEAGVMGPVVGVVAALQADLALRTLVGDKSGGQLATFDGKTGEHRQRKVRSRKDCPLCGTRSIETIDEARYMGPSCDASPP
jgi:molybdopterin/thiamine biosynthesis adenylyltransferase